MYNRTRKSTHKVQKYLYSIVLMFIVSFFIVPRASYAILSWDRIQSLTDPNRFCNPTKKIFEDIAKDQPQQSIVRFGYNYDSVRTLKIFYNVFGVSPDNAIRCIGVIPITNFSLTGKFCEVLTGMDPEAACGNFMLGYNGGMDGNASIPERKGLLGLYLTTKESVDRLGNPLDLNYFAYKTTEKIPFVGKALAQTTETQYKAPIVDNVYYAWKLVRNLCFGVFALLMLVVGIMMINRTKLSTQSVVTIQYALPKIIIAIILITFSYPIAALMTTFFYHLGSVLSGAIFSFGWGDITQQIKDQYFSGTDFKFGAFVLQILLSVIVTLGVSMVAILLSLILIFLILIQMIMILVKFFVYYVKMILQIVLAPVSFVYYAIPGNDDAATGWFKKMLALGLSITVLRAVPTLVFFIATTVVISYPETSMGGNGWGITDMLTFNSPAVWMLALPLMIVYMGLSMTLKLPAQIEEVLTGKKKGR